MTSRDDWQTAFALADLALDLPVAERKIWLAKIAPEHEHLRPLLHDMLEVGITGSAHHFLETLPKLAGFNDDSIERFVGDAGIIVGPYRLIRELGAGGMGTVWLAARADGAIKREVALKLPHTGLHRQLLAERFRRELDILAALDHPNIARLYDAGIANGNLGEGETGQPYMALEYVDGKPIDQYCRDAKLNIRDKIALFLQVLDAVHFAHSRLVNHRDIKPSNILVTADGQVRLLDFGIAKLLAANDSQPTAAQTELSSRVFTPDYASPEQITGLPVGTGSDIYSLGVVLYELLCGKAPYKLKRNSRGALEDAIVESIISRPSTQMRKDSSQKNDKHNIGSAKAINADLDAVVLKALQKKPEDRYESVAAFAQDLRNHLDNRPVLARAPSPLYQLGKFIERHKLSSALVLGGVLTLVATTTISVMQAKIASREAKTANEIKDFLIGTFRNTNPVEAKGADFTAREMLDQSTAQAEIRFKDSPVIQAELFAALSRSYGLLGRELKSRELSEKALTNMAAAFGPHDARVQLAKVALAESASSAFDFVTYRRLDRELAAFCVEPLVKQPETSPCWLAEYYRARYEYTSGQLKQSQARFRALIAAAQTVKPGPYLWAAPYADVYIMMSDLYSGKTKSATDLAAMSARQNLASDKSVTDTIWASDLNTISRLLAAKGDLVRARDVADTSFNLRKRQYGKTPLWNYSQQRQLGIAEGALGNIVEAEKLFSEAIAGSEKRFGGPNYDSGLTREAWGLMLLNEGRALEAKPMLEEARQIQVAINTIDNCWLARINVALAAVNGVLGATAESRAALDGLIETADAQEDIFTSRRARYWRARLSDKPDEIPALLTRMLSEEKNAPPERTAIAVDARLLLAENTVDKNAQWLHLEKAATEAAHVWGTNNPDNRYAERALQRAINLRPDAKAVLRDAFEHAAKEVQQDDLGTIVDAINARTFVMIKK